TCAPPRRKDSRRRRRPRVSHVRKLVHAARAFRGVLLVGSGMSQSGARQASTGISYERLKNWPFPAVEQTYSERDTMLYALGIGLGADPLDARQLRFVYEENLLALPTMPAVLASPGMWMRDPACGIDWVRMLHGEQQTTIVEPLPAAAPIVGRRRIP